MHGTDEPLRVADHRDDDTDAREDREPVSDIDVAVHDDEEDASGGDDPGQDATRHRRDPGQIRRREQIQAAERAERLEGDRLLLIGEQ